MKGLLAALAVMAAAWSTAAPTHAQVTLQNDGFTNGASVGVELGFGAGEMAASRFVAAGPVTLQRVQFFFGGAPGQRDITLHVYDDSGATLNPGTELFTGDYTATGSDTALQEIDLTANSVTVPATFRVAIEMPGMGAPSLARDDDLNITPNRNFLYGDIGAGTRWNAATSAGLTGDWIIRAIVSDAGGTPDAGTTGPDAGTTGPDAGTAGPDAGTGGPDAGTGGSCNGNAECPVGQFCDTQLHSCTFECRTNADCGGATCNSLGQCLAADGDSGGCCSTGTTTTGGMLGALGLAGAVGLLVTRRRRR